MGELTRFATSGGCAAKVGPGELRGILASLPAQSDAALLVGAETSDDAGVYALDAERALVVTADYITPVVDDPFLYGQVAAANAISDIYAMGGRPLCAVALCMFPKELAPELAREILHGGQDKTVEAGAVIAGGHTVRSPELFYGLAVTGLVERRRVLANTGAKVGDQLVLTKPLGSGLVVNGLRGGKLTIDEAKPVLQKMAMLNRAAAEAALDCGDSVHAATDVTGFGLVGHALNVARGSKVALKIKLSSLSVYPHALAMHTAGVTTKSTKPNREAAAGLVHGFMLEFADALVHDPQTSGGLLLATSDGEKLVAALRNRGVEDAAVIGEVVAGEPSITFTHGEA